MSFFFRIKSELSEEKTPGVSGGQNSDGYTKWGRGHHGPPFESDKDERMAAEPFEEQPE
jgi:hypothetical protein